MNLQLPLLFNMNPDYILKLATKEPEVTPPPRVVPPLAQVKAQQLNVPLQELLTGSITNVMNFITNGLKNKTITTKQANKDVPDYTGAINDFAQQHTISPQDDIDSRRLRALYSPYGLGIGPKGAWDAMSIVRTITDPNVIKGMGENVLSMKKFQNIANIKNIGSMGRNGGSRLS